MIGNDIVDLDKAKQDSDIFRPRYLEKICTKEEIELVLSSYNPIYTFWRLWTMKESVYKAFQRKFGFKPVFNPFAFMCRFDDSDVGNVSYHGHQVSTKSIQHEDYMYSEVLNSEGNKRYFGTTTDFLLNLKTEFNLKSLPEIRKIAGMPNLLLLDEILPLSKTHHGKFQAFQY